MLSCLSMLPVFVYATVLVRLIHAYASDEVEGAGEDGEDGAEGNEVAARAAEAAYRLLSGGGGRDRDSSKESNSANKARMLSLGAPSAFAAMQRSPPATSEAKKWAGLALERLA